METTAEKQWGDRARKWHGPLGYSSYLKGIYEYKQALREAIQKEESEKFEEPSSYDKGFDAGLVRALELMETVTPKE